MTLFYQHKSWYEWQETIWTTELNRQQQVLLCKSIQSTCFLSHLSLTHIFSDRKFLKLHMFSIKPVVLTVACLSLPLPWSCVPVWIIPNSITNSAKWGTTVCIAWLKISLRIFHLALIQTGKRRRLSLKRKILFVLVVVSTTVRWQNACPVTNVFTLDALAVVEQKCKKKKMRHQYTCSNSSKSQWLCHSSHDMHFAGVHM